MRVTVIKSFPFSVDGFNQLHAAAGPEPQEIPDALVPSLIADGYVCPDGHPPVAMTAHRRKAIVDRVIVQFRAHLETLTDDELLEWSNRADRQDRADAESDDEEDDEADDDFLLGSSVLGAIVEVGALRVLLGGVVAASHAESGLDTEAWNDLAEADREARLAATIARLAQSHEAAAAELPTETILPELKAGAPAINSPAVVLPPEDPAAPLGHGEGQPVEIPADWKALHWKQRVALAKALGWTDGDPTAEQADGWISDRLVHREREKPLDELGGLSLREVHAELTTLGVEWEAEASPADLLALLEAKKADKPAADGAE